MKFLRSRPFSDLGQRSLVRHMSSFSNFLPLKLLGQFQMNSVCSFHAVVPVLQVAQWEVSIVAHTLSVLAFMQRGKKLYIGQCHMIKMTAKPMYGENHKNSIAFQLVM